MEQFAALIPANLLWLMFGAGVAGLVRGFSGFGTAMVYLPIASQVLTPFETLSTMVIMDVFGPLPRIRGMLAKGHPRDIGRLAVGMLVTLPLGLFVLTLVAPEVFRYAVSGVALALLAMLVLGMRYRGRLGPPLIYGTGGISGFLAGTCGLSGPPVILLYMASSHPASVIRANIFVFLFLSDIAMLGMLALAGLLVPGALLTGLLLVPVYFLAIRAGSAIFSPEREGLYRTVAYLIIAASALSGLPLWD